jgi:hypothetical protein
VEQISIPVGELLRDVGMMRTLAAEPDTWIDGALAALTRFAGAGRSFRMEQFRAWYLEGGYAEPHDHHVWGALTNRAAKEGVIHFTGRYEPSESARTHGHDVKVWEGCA